MSIEFEMEEDGKIRVRVDTAGQRAMSEAMDPVDLIRQVMDEAELDVEDLEGQLPGENPDETTEPTEPTEGFPNDEETEDINQPEDPERGLDEDPGDNGSGDMTDDVTEPSKIDESAPPEGESA